MSDDPSVIKAKWRRKKDWMAPIPPKPPVARCAPPPAVVDPWRVTNCTPGSGLDCDGAGFRRLHLNEHWMRP